MFATSKSSELAVVGDVAGAIDFDGTNDYLSRASDLTGNADGKTFTFSAWLYRTAAVDTVIYWTGSGPGVAVNVAAAGGIAITCRNVGGVAILNASAVVNFPLNTFCHLSISIDLANAANRFVYFNDIATAPTWTTYTNDTIDFTVTPHAIAAQNTGGGKNTQRLAHIYLDKTYRDLSIEANRRLFITADRKPAAGQAALNPILYLPLTDPTAPGKNLGTGGDFALTGVVARSGRGPNQFNAPYSNLDGSLDYLSRTTALTGLADGKTFTFAASFLFDTAGTTLFGLFGIFDNGNTRLSVHITSTGGLYRLAISGADSGNGSVLSAASSLGAVTVNRNYHLVVSVDLSNTANRSVYLNGQALSMTWGGYSNSNIDFAPVIPVMWVGRDSVNSAYWNGPFGNVYFDTKYIDLSQPANLAKFVTGTGIDAKPVDMGANGELPTGTAPLIYLPMYGNNAGKNYGTGGDFTVNSGPYPGARGPNEFWGNKVGLATASNYLTRNTPLTGLTTTSVLSFSFFFYKASLPVGYYSIFSIDDPAGGSLTIGINELSLQFSFSEPNNASIGTVTVGLSSAGAYHVVFSVNSTTGYWQLRYAKESVLTYTTSTGTFTNTNKLIKMSGPNPLIGKLSPAYSYGFDGTLSEIYLTTDYIDFGQEVNRLKFRDAFGNPVALQPQIDAGTLPNPAIYMRFDPANFGKNSGTGGDFVQAGTITDGGQL